MAVDYKKMYTTLFQGVTKAINGLQEAQRETEDEYLNADPAGIVPTLLTNAERQAKKMMPIGKSILEQLFLGDICPSEHIGNDSPEYQKAQSLLADKKAKFAQCLSDNDREDFQKLEELQNIAAGIYSYECFAHGFRLGISLQREA